MMLFYKLFDAADNYLKECKWTDMALLKFCLCSVGIIIGMSIPKGKKNTVRIAAGAVFAVTYLPLMAKFLPFLIDEFKDAER